MVGQHSISLYKHIKNRLNLNCFCNINVNRGKKFINYDESILSSFLRKYGMVFCFIFNWPILITIIVVIIILSFFIPECKHSDDKKCKNTKKIIKIRTGFFVWLGLCIIYLGFHEYYFSINNELTFMKKMIEVTGKLIRDINNEKNAEEKFNNLKERIKNLNDLKKLKEILKKESTEYIKRESDRISGNFDPHNIETYQNHSDPEAKIIIHQILDSVAERLRIRKIDENDPKWNNELFPLSNLLNSIKPNDIKALKKERDKIVQYTYYIKLVHQFPNYVIH